ncbi:N-acylphosphatidylethanolamine synthase-like [Dorcoceras hygrometricum]|uniref:N-acylphosphatidylethanolamine synthase-like n=1 Tax=Dorcoceras hygrometricum TaxID=472368 RepID=A0A2Z7ACD1_9LAMI|nr:N-acylphosphatidylethanolamine synthase-like [Dorcoceras hygrometricum]
MDKQYKLPWTCAGIYIGNGKVVHFTRGAGHEIGIGTVFDRIIFSASPSDGSGSPCPRCGDHSSDSGVISSCLECFLSGGELYVFQYGVSPSIFLAKARGGTCTFACSDPADDVLHRAEYLLQNGFGVYQIFKNNCEDFAIYCKTGLLIFTDISVGRSGQAASFIAAATAIVSSPLRFMTTGFTDLWHALPHNIDAPEGTTTQDPEEEESKELKKNMDGNPSQKFENGQVGGGSGMRKMEWASRSEHLGGVPRKIVFTAVGAFAKAVVNLFNTTTVHNAGTLLRLVRCRPSGVPLLTVSNHMSTMDDPLMWGLKDFPITDPKLGKCIPITRGGGIYQEHMNEALEYLRVGSWLHTFPEGKVCQEDAPIQRLKWGTASLIVRAPVTPIVLPIVHNGFEKVMPEKYIFGRRPPFPLWNREIKIVIGEPMIFGVPKLKQRAVEISKDLPFSGVGWPKLTPCGLDEAAQRCLYKIISERIQAAMESLRNAASSAGMRLRKLEMMAGLSAECGPVVAFTTPQNYAGRLSRLIHLRGWAPLWCPTLIVESTPHTISCIQAAITSSLHHCSAIAFTSRSGITAFADVLSSIEIPPLAPYGEAFIISALGKDSELLDGSFVGKLCGNPGRIRVVVPPVATPSGMVESIGSGEGKRVMCPVPLVVGIEEPPVVPEFMADLGRRGWVVLRVDAYETRWRREEGGGVEELVKRIKEGRGVDAIVFTSTGEVEGLLRSLSEVGLAWRAVRQMCPSMVAAAHGPVTAAGAERLGVCVDVVSSRFDSFDGLVDVLDRCWNS